MKGVPLRIEFGPKDAAKSVISYARRDTGEKGTIPLAEVGTQVPALLEQIQQDMYNKANAEFAAHRLRLDSWDKVVPALNDKNVVLIPFCHEPKCEDEIKESTKSDEARELGPDGKLQPSMGMKSLCIPFEQVRFGLLVFSGWVNMLIMMFSSPRELCRVRPSASTPAVDGMPSRGSCLVAATRLDCSLLLSRWVAGGICHGRQVCFVELRTFSLLFFAEMNINISSVVDPCRSEGMVAFVC